MAITSNAEVAGKVRAAAAEQRISQADLADTLRISRMAMSRRFSGDTPFTPEELIQLARRFRVPVAVFFGELASAPAVSSPHETAGVPEAVAS